MPGKKDKDQRYVPQPHKASFAMDYTPLTTVPAKCEA
jgi:hypothetical protein